MSSPFDPGRHPLRLVDMRRWLVQSMRRMIFNDVYKPHSVQELRLSPAALSSLDAGKSYGVWWYNQDRVTLTPDDRKRRRRFKRNDPADWVAIPIPDVGILLATVEAARADINQRYRPRKNSSRFYGLRGLAACECGGGLTTWHTAGEGRRYDYYTCVQRRKHGKAACSVPQWRAEDLEGTVAAYVSYLVSDPKRIKAELDAAIADELKALQDPDTTAKLWADTISECVRLREAYQDQQAAGLMTLDEPGRKLADLEETRAAAQRELDRLRDGQRRIKELKAGRRALLKAYGKGLLQGIEWFPPELRRDIYELMGLRVTALEDGRLRVAANVDARIVRLTRNVEDYARRRQEWERRWSDNPADFKELAARIGARLREQGEARIQHRFGQAFDQAEVSPTTTDMTSSEMSKLA